MKTKYNSTKTIVDEIKFDSKLEARFYEYIKTNTNIQLLGRQNKFVLQEKTKVNGEHIREIAYKCDFHILYNNKEYYIDSKGMQDAVFKIKHKMFKYRYGTTHKLIVCKSIKELMNILKTESGSL